MTIETVGLLVAMVLAVSLATERVVTILKTWFPSLDKDREGGAEQARRGVVQILAIVVALVISAFLAEGGQFQLGGTVQLADGAAGIPVWVMGLLGSGGSAVWKDILAITNEIKKVKEKAA